MLTYTEPEVDDTPQHTIPDQASAPHDTAPTTPAGLDDTGTQDIRATGGDPAQQVLKLDEFLWLAVSSQAQLQALTDMPMADLNDDQLGRERFTTMHRRHRRQARKVVPSSMYDQLRSTTPALPRGRTPTAAELRSAYAGFDSWCQHVYAWAKHQMTARPPAPTTSPATPGAQPPGQYL